MQHDDKEKKKKKKTTNNLAIGLVSSALAISIGYHNLFQN